MQLPGRGIDYEMSVYLGRNGRIGRLGTATCGQVTVSKAARIIMMVMMIVEQRVRVVIDMFAITGQLFVAYELYGLTLRSG